MVTTKKEHHCKLCGRELIGEDLEFAKTRDEDSKVFVSAVHRPGVSSRIRKVWELQGNTYFCKECMLKPENWREKNNVCINCDFFMMNFTGLPSVSDFYCRLKEGKVINAPGEDSCERWKLAAFFIPPDLPL